MRVLLSCSAAMLCLCAVPAHAKQGDSSNKLSQGMVQLYLRVGTTTQYEVLEAFGGPNISTLDGDGREVWVYDRHATVSYDKSSGFSIGILAGGGGGGAGAAGGLGFGSRKSRSEQSSRTMTLIIKFGPDKKVVDFKSRSSSF